MIWLYNIYLTLVAMSAVMAAITSALLFRIKDPATNPLAFCFMVIAFEAVRGAIMQGMFGFSSRISVGFIWFAIAVRTIKTLAITWVALDLLGIVKIGIRKRLSDE